MGRMPFKWWFCFGTLLTVVRDGSKFKKLDDIDIGVFYDEYDVHAFETIARAFSLKVQRKIIDDVTKKPLYISFKVSENVVADAAPIEVDIFAWYKWKGLYWHTYDVDMENPKNGIPKRYTLKGVPCWMLDQKIIKLDNFADTMLPGCIPLKYGSLMDEWYGHWLEPKECVSDTRWKIKVKSMSDLKTGKVKKLAWPDE
jgi:hypothetical protein